VVANVADIWRPDNRSNAIAYDIAMVIAGSLLIALSAQISFNIGPVPITGQTFGVLLVGALLGWKRGGAAVLAYLAEGASGLPVFAGATGGAAVFLGPTAGYLAGFVPAAMLVGWLAQLGWDRHFGLTVLAMIGGNLIIYLFGVPWLRTVLAVDWPTAFSYGLTPFVAGDLVKILFAAVVLPYGWTILNQVRPKQ